jgi:hypothetical protein
MTATMALETIWPPKARQVFPASFFRPKPPLEFEQRLGKLFRHQHILANHLSYVHMQGPDTVHQKKRFFSSLLVVNEMDQS